MDSPTVSKITVIQKSICGEAEGSSLPRRYAIGAVGAKIATVLLVDKPHIDINPIG